MNLASLVRGFAYMVYHGNWWWPSMRSALVSLNRLILVPNFLVRKWVGDSWAPAALCGKDRTNPHRVSMVHMHMKSTRDETTKKL